MRSLQEIVDGIVSDSRTMVPAQWPYPVAPVMVQRSPGAPAQPLVWQARLTDNRFYHEFKCCDQWTGVIFYYEWEGILNHLSAGPFVMPKMIIIPDGPFNCFQEQGWPQNYALTQVNAGGASGVTGNWAINTAEFTYDHRLGRGPTTFPKPICVRADKRCAVTMSLGYWIDPQRCIQDPNVPGSQLLESKTSRYIPFFHQYKAELHSAC